jgi:anhydro-N-acetylmuramic acid kinase
VMATLSELTARTVSQALTAQAPLTKALYVCGGGACNTDLMRRLQGQLPGLRLQSTAALGVAPDQVEALAFAWLARACLEGQAGNLPAVTGARGPRVLGAIYQAG